VDIEGWTILHRGALSSDLGMIRLLASQDLSGVDAEAKDNFNKTAFEYLVELNPCTEMLVTFTAILTSIKQASVIEGEGDIDDSSTESSLFEYEDALEYGVDGTNVPSALNNVPESLDSPSFGNL
jgi:hypothetical protein